MAVNNQLQDLNITHQQNVELYKRTLANRAERIYKRGVNRLRTTLLSYVDANDNKIPSSTVRKTIEEELLSILDEINEEFENTLNKEISDFTESEQRFYSSSLSKVFTGLNLVIPVTNLENGVAFRQTKSESINLQDGRRGRYLEELRNPGLKSKRYVRDNVRKTFALGTSIYVLSRLLFSSNQGLFNSIFRSLRVTATLLAQHATSTTRKNVYEQNNNIIKGYKWVSVLDARTSDTCQYLSERVWYYNNPDRSTLPGPIEPPAHYNCRSTTAPIVMSSRELPDSIINSQTIAVASIAAALTGRVPQRTSYLQWLKRQPASIQREVLGLVRYRLWKNGEIQIESFYSKDARYYTLEELNQLGVDIPDEYLRYVNGEE